MIDIKLDPITHDIVLTTDGDLVLTDGIESIAQGLRIRLATISKEWYLDKRIGVIYLDEDKPDPDDTVSRIRKEIMNEVGVTRIDSFESTFNAQTRVLSVNFIVMTVYGELIVNEGIEL